MKKSFIFLLLIISLNIQATTYYVKTDGRNSNNGLANTSAGAWQTLSYACSRAQSWGDIIQVDAGSYTESARCYLTTGVSLIGAGRSTTIITLTYNYTGNSPEENGNLQLQSDSPNTNGNQTISGITFDGNNWGSKMGIVVWNRSNVIFHDVTIRNFDWGGIQFWNSGYSTYNRNNSFYNSTITACGKRGGGGAFNFKCQKSLYVHDNVFTNIGRSQGLNGNIVYSVWGNSEDFKFYNNVCTKPVYDGGAWNFHMEVWDVKGGYEYYGNTFNGGECAIDISSPTAQYAYGHFKNGYAYSHYIHNNTFQYASKYPAPDDDRIAVQLEDCWINDVIIEANHFLRTPQPITFTMGSADAGPYNNIDIHYNIFEDIGYANSGFSSCVYLRGDNSGADYRNIKFDNNIVKSGPSGNINAAFNIFTTGQVDGLSIRNNIIENCSIAWIYTENVWGSGHVYHLTATNNILYNNANSNAILDGAGIIDASTKVVSNPSSADPVFMAGTPYNFHLQAGSPAINAGTNVGLTKDYEGNIMVGNPDIGAYEYNGVPSANIPVTAVTVTGAGGAIKIDVNHGTLQMSAHIDPHNATNQGVVWSVINGTGSATIDQNGLLTPITNGTVTVKATSTYQSSSFKTYYVKNSGSDSNTGLSDAQAWQTIAKVNASTFNPGDQILFNAGDMWRETLTPTSSGNSSAFVTFGAYGDYATAPPVINGADVLTGWTNEGSNVWSNDCPVYDNLGFFAHDVHYVGMGDNESTFLVQVNSLGEVNVDYTYFIDDSTTPSKIYFYSATNPLSTVDISARMFGGYIGGKTYVKVENIAFINAAHTGLFLHATTGTTFAGHNLISHCLLTQNREAGIYIDNGYSYNTVEYCNSGANGNGFYIWSDDEVTCNTSNNTYSHNNSEYNIVYAITGALTDGHGFGIYNSTNNIIEYNESSGDKYGINIDIAGHNNSIIIRGNYVHDGQTASPGIQVGGDASGFTHEVYNNLVVNCGDGDSGMPILVIGTTRTGTVNLYNNTIYQDGSAGKSIYGIYASKGTNLNIKNNIIYNNAAVPIVLTIASSGTGMVINNNLYYAPTLTYAKFYKGAYYSGLAAWQALGYDANGIYADPLFTDNASDWSLQSGSPAINTGASVGLTLDRLGSPIVGNPDMGAHEKQ